LPGGHEEVDNHEKRRLEGVLVDIYRLKKKKKGGGEGEQGGGGAKKGKKKKRKGGWGGNCGIF